MQSPNCQIKITVNISAYTVSCDYQPVVMVTMLGRFLTFMETCEPEVLFTEEELAELLKDSMPSGVSVNSEVGCHGN